MSGRATRRSAVALAVLTVCVEVVQHTAGLDIGLLHLAPALLLLVPLLAGCYVGEERLAALATGRAPGRPRVRARLVRSPSRAPRVLLARGGELLAASLAQRGPPAAAVAP